jgi:hypothetical protein
MTRRIVCTMAARNDNKLEKMRKQNEQLKREVAIQRVPISVTAAACVRGLLATHASLALI